LGFKIEKTLTVSHFRLGILKRLIPARWLAALDGIFQPSGRFIQLTPSVFVKSKVPGNLSSSESPKNIVEIFKCPDCGSGSLIEKNDHLLCPSCTAKWGIQDGIYDFR
jgi:hypothetical protein